MRFPSRVVPMLATLVPEPFHRSGWTYEEKYDGIRILAFKRGRDVVMRTRNGIDRRASFPAVATALGHLASRELIVDGEIIAVDRAGVSRFQLLQRGGSVRFAIFDCLFAAGHDLRREPLQTRRQALLEVLKPGGPLRRVRRLAANGLQAYRDARDRGLEGIVAKNCASQYESGRSVQWLKVKVRNAEEFVIGGYTEPSGSRQHFGALLLGRYDRRGLRYVGRVGTGFPRTTLAALIRKLQALERRSSPFVPPPRITGVHWVTPQLVAQVAFHEWTADGRLRQPAFLGLRLDKRAEDVGVSEGHS
jgi:bifunctional non-homologous end joining protein LigD